MNITPVIPCGGSGILVSESESTCIPMDTTHRLGNSGKVPMEIIEVQSCSYFCEDDIVHFANI
jgi:mannose-1-phosphate guanylyltransferase/mannose-6-phosphate isomerase